MISLPLSFEEFDVGSASNSIESAEFLRGVEEGLARAYADIAAQQTAALSEIAAVLADMAFGFAEAKQQLEGALRPLILQVADEILPEIAREAFSAHLADAVTDAFSNSASKPISIFVAPTSAQMLNTALADDQNGRFVFIEDACLAAGQAIVQHGDVYELLDLPALTTSLQTILRGLATSERNISHG